MKAVRGEQRGYDAAKKITGRKRHLLTDTRGLVLACLVTSAAVSDAQGAALLLAKAGDKVRGVEVIWADTAYNNRALDDAWPALTSARLEVVKRPKGAKGFVVLKKRWIVERTNAHHSMNRRLALDHERTVKSSQAWLDIGQMSLLLNRI